MDHLGCGVPPEEADTARLFIDGLDQVFHRRGDRVFQIPPKGPVLAEEAVEVAGPVEDCQVLVSVFWARGIGKPWVARAAATRADPCCAAVGRKPVVIPVADPLEAAGRNGEESPLLVLIHSTEPFLTGGDAALIEADRACLPFKVAGGFWRQVVPCPVAAMDLPDIVCNLAKMGSDTVEAVTDGLRDQGRFFLAAVTLHFRLPLAKPRV